MANSSIKFQKGDLVNVFRRNGDLYTTGKIADTHTNLCTFDQEYDVEYFKDGKELTLLCVPENFIKLASN